jgi:HK97 gp10 family phage protein
MADEVQLRVQGLADLKAALAGLAKNLRRRALRNALAAGARVIRDEARRRAPVLDPRKPRSQAAAIKGWRKAGTIRRAISVRTSKFASRGGDVGVFVNVRPAKKGSRGAKNPNDPYYWRWQEFGWTPASKRTGGFGKKGAKFRRHLNKIGAPKAQPGRFFMKAASAKLEDALRAFEASLGPQIQKLNTVRFQR